MRAATGGRQGEVYRCITGTDYAPKAPVKHVSLSRAVADPLVTDELLRALLMAPTDALPESEAATDLGTLHAALGEVRAEVQRLVDAVVKGLLDDSDVQAQRAALRAREDDLRARVTEATAANATAGLVSDLRRSLWVGGSPSLETAAEARRELRSNFEAMTLADKRNLVSAMLRVTVHPGRGPERVKVTHLVATSLNDG